MSVSGKSGESRTVGRALFLLDLIASKKTPMRLSDIAHGSGFDITTTSRLLNSLQRYGYVMRDRSAGCYRLGYKLLHLAYIVQQQSGLRDIADPILQQLVDATQETATVNVLEDTQIMVSARIVSSSQLRIFSPIGARGPLYCTAAGKAILAFQPEPDIERIIALGMPRETPLTITEPAAMRAELIRIRQQGYALDRGEREEGLIGVAAPVRDAAGVCFASCSVSGSELRLSVERISDVIGHVRHAATEISLRLGWHRSASEAAD